METCGGGRTTDFPLRGRIDHADGSDCFAQDYRICRVGVNYGLRGLLPLQHSDKGVIRENEAAINHATVEIESAAESAIKAFGIVAVQQAAFGASVADRQATTVAEEGFGAIAGHAAGPQGAAQRIDTDGANLVVPVAIICVSQRQSLHEGIRVVDVPRAVHGSRQRIIRSPRTPLSGTPP